MKWWMNRIKVEKRKDLLGIFSFFYAFYGIITIIQTDKSIISE